jgi:hypothetical protein
MPPLFLEGETFGRQDMGAAISNLQFLAEYLGGISGRKNLIWLADKFPVPQGPVFMAIFRQRNHEQGSVRGAKCLRRHDAQPGCGLSRRFERGGCVRGEQPVAYRRRRSEPVTHGVNMRARKNRGIGRRRSRRTREESAPAPPGQNTLEGSTTSIAGQTIGLSGYSVTSVDQFREEYIAKATGGQAYYSKNNISVNLAKCGGVRLELLHAQLFAN